jgi:formylglycine-generating enzyme
VNLVYFARRNLATLTTHMKSFTTSLALALATCGIMVCSSATAGVSITTVNVVNVGNANDTTGYGGVGYVYGIGTYEVTLNQYANFLNSVAATDTYSLYNVNMAANVNVAGITRSGSSGSYTYAISGDGNRPVTYVSWFDAARFVNWLDNGCPLGGQVAGTTETGAYALNGATSGIINSSLAGSGWRLPTESEWYKAAYYQPLSQGGPTSSYWTYATRSNTQPNSRTPNSVDQNSGNFYYNDNIGGPYNGGYAVNNSTALPTGSAITAAGAYALALSYAGTYDQNGNAAEWTDGVFGSLRVVRGGSWGDNNLAASSRSSNLPTTESQFIGFRAVDVPEPGVAGFLALGLALLVFRLKRVR